ncbi:MAG TPA: acyl-CoA carboxylase subunit epsilon [Streptosporangiaceae bacterium]|nr:acyl-CoA carboxylase subunit epsilon [Streptosporangiaceae bacterium]
MPTNVQVVRGEPTAEELAAVLVVLGGRASRAVPAQAGRPRHSAWAARDRMMRPPVMAGPGAWRASTLPGR